MTSVGSMWPISQPASTMSRRIGASRSLWAWTFPSSAIQRRPRRRPMGSCPKTRRTPAGGRSPSGGTGGSSTSTRTCSPAHTEPTLRRGSSPSAWPPGNKESRVEAPPPRGVAPPPPSCSDPRRRKEPHPARQHSRGPEVSLKDPGPLPRITSPPENRETSSGPYVLERVGVAKGKRSRPGGGPPSSCTAPQAPPPEGRMPTGRGPSGFMREELR